VFSTDFLKVLLAGKLRQRLTPLVMHRLDQVLGGVLIICGFSLLWQLIYGSAHLH
jgi:threonine/homoserine/homoserine lactone efflux protein